MKQNDFFRIFGKTVWVALMLLVGLLGCFALQYIHQQNFEIFRPCLIGKTNMLFIGVGILWGSICVALSLIVSEAPE